MKQTKEEQLDEEANYFAMHLLVPTSLLEKEMPAGYEIDLTDDKTLIDLAKKFAVPINVMAFRISEVLSKRRAIAKLSG
jgi:Zn-dependent peptidase ImmA (M78 family)